MTFEKEELDELQQMYGHDKVSRFKFIPKFLFKRMMENLDTDEVLQLIRNVAEKSGVGESSTKFRELRLSNFDAAKILIELLRDYEPYDIRGLKKDLNPGYKDSERRLKTKLFDKVNMKYDQTTMNLPDFLPIYLLLNKVYDGDVLYKLYGDAILDFITNSDLEDVASKKMRDGKVTFNYSFSTQEKDFFFSNVDTPINSYHDLIEASRNFDKSQSYRNPILPFNSILRIVLEKYPISELMNNSETIKEEIRTGFFRFLPDREEIFTHSNPDKKHLAEPNIFSNNREVFDKMLSHFDSETLSIIMHSAEYLNPMLSLMNSKGIKGEDKENIAESYEMFKEIAEIVKTQKFGKLLSLITSIEEKHKEPSGEIPKFSEVLNDALLSYETIMRTEIVENTRTIDPEKLESEKLQDERFIPIGDFRYPVIEKVDQLSSTLVSFIEEPRERILTFGVICYQYFLEKNIGNMSRTQFLNATAEFERRLQATEQMDEHNYFNDYNVTNVAQLMNPKLSDLDFEFAGFPDMEKPTNKPEEGMTDEPLLSRDELQLCLKRYNEHIQKDNLGVHEAKLKTSQKTYEFIEGLLKDCEGKETDAEKRLYDMAFNMRKFFHKSYFGFDRRHGDIMTASLLRVDNLEDFWKQIPRCNPNSAFGNDGVQMALAYDGKGIQDEGILYTALSQQSDASTWVHYGAYPGDGLVGKSPVEDRSAPLSTLLTKSERDYSGDEKNEIALDPNFVKNPSIMLIFYTPKYTPSHGQTRDYSLTDASAKKVQNAIEYAEHNHLTPVLVNCTSIGLELGERDKERERRYDAQTAEVSKANKVEDTQQASQAK